MVKAVRHSAKDKQVLMIYIDKKLFGCFHFFITRCKPYIALFSTFLIILLLTAAYSKATYATEVQSKGPNLHRLWHNNCLTCHGHSAEFSRKYLKVEEGKLLGSLHVNNLRLFLHNHYLAGKEVDAIYNMLLAQVSSQPRYQQECSSCHGIAAEFVQKSLILREGELYSRKLESSTRSFLLKHRNLNEKDVEFFMQQLTRVAHEVYRP